MGRVFDIVALAKRVNQRREEWHHLHPHRHIRVSPALSRILENDPDYVPARKRNPAKKRRAAKNPSIRTLVAIAAALGTTVGDLLGEPMPLSPAEEKMLRDFIRMAERLRAQQPSK